MLHFELVNAEKGIVKVKRHGNKYILNYPCIESHDCTEYRSIFPQGIYQIELFGASGGGKNISTTRSINQTECVNQEEVFLYGGNTECINDKSLGGAGGYTSSILKIREDNILNYSVCPQGKTTVN